ncbi:hypothetical protein IYY11_00225 [Methylocystis sp. H62]|uniref:hypothetical protein n=1 Tax=Methylocystis sp. H62 TaxID=2785789 RepID=UPI0018C2D791|nr:hypothetical protein [Methylocystis sp. H62]MBG0791942.1 hypothetical protein [Methylocystis sp. H62]
MPDFYNLSNIPPLQAARWIIKQDPHVSFLIIILIFVFRSGIGFDYGADGDVIAIAEAFPTPLADYKGLSIISPIIAHYVGAHTEFEWCILHIILVCVIFYLAWRLVQRQFLEASTRQFIWIALCGSGAGVVAIGKIGHYDIWMFAASMLLLFDRNWRGAVLSGLLFGFTNVEQGLVALAALAICAYAIDREFIKIICLSVLSMLFARAILQLWYLHNNVDVHTRASLVIGWLRLSLRGFLQAWPVQIYSWFSASWILVLYMIFIGGRATRALIASGAIVLPALATSITADGTRVFAVTSFPSFLLLIRYMSADKSMEAVRVHLAIFILSVMLISPGIMTWVGGSVARPYAQLLDIMLTLGGRVGH